MPTRQQYIVPRDWWSGHQISCHCLSRWQYCTLLNFFPMWWVHCASRTGLPMSATCNWIHTRHTETETAPFAYACEPNLATQHTDKCCGKCLTCFRVAGVRRTAREAGTTRVCVRTAGTGGWQPGGATHIHGLVLLCKTQYRTCETRGGEKGSGVNHHQFSLPQIRKQ